MSISMPKGYCNFDIVGEILSRQMTLNGANSAAFCVETISFSNLEHISDCFYDYCLFLLVTPFLFFSLSLDLLSFLY